MGKLEGIVPSDARRKPPLGLAQDVTVPIALAAEDATARPDLRGRSDA